MPLPEKVKFRGVAFEWGDETVIVPPLPMNATRDHEEKLKAVKYADPANPDTETGHKRAAVMLEAIKASLGRNYTGSEIDTDDFLNLVNFGDVYAAAIGLEVNSVTARPLGPRVKSAAEIPAASPSR